MISSEQEILFLRIKCFPEEPFFRCEWVHVQILIGTKLVAKPQYIVPLAGVNEINYWSLGLLIAN